MKNLHTYRWQQTYFFINRNFSRKISLNLIRAQTETTLGLYFNFYRYEINSGGSNKTLIRVDQENFPKSIKGSRKRKEQAGNSRGKEKQQRKRGRKGR